MDNVNTEPPKFCINCAHVATNGSGDSGIYKCMAPQNAAGVDLVTGSKIYDIVFCRTHREITENSPKYCTAAGNWFEPKPIRPVYTPTPTPATKPASKIISRNLADNLGM